MEGPVEIKGPDKLDAARDYENEEITAPQISKFLTEYVQETRKGLKRFYKNPTEDLSEVSDRIKRAVEMANILRRTSGREIALMLTILVLYDLVMLIGMYCSV